MIDAWRTLLPGRVDATTMANGAAPASDGRFGARGHGMARDAIVRRRGLTIRRGGEPPPCSHLPDPDVRPPNDARRAGADAFGTIDT
jgi:hypothetical protein